MRDIYRRIEIYNKEIKTERAKGQSNTIGKTITTEKKPETNIRISNTLIEKEYNINKADIITDKETVIIIIDKRKVRETTDIIMQNSGQISEIWNHHIRMMSIFKQAEIIKEICLINIPMMTLDLKITITMAQRIHRVEKDPIVDFNIILQYPNLIYHKLHYLHHHHPSHHHRHHPIDHSKEETLIPHFQMSLHQGPDRKEEELLISDL